MHVIIVFTQQYMHPWVDHVLSLLTFNSDQCELCVSPVKVFCYNMNIFRNTHHKIDPAIKKGA